MQMNVTNFMQIGAFQMQMSAIKIMQMRCILYANERD